MLAGVVSSSLVHFCGKNSKVKLHIALYITVHFYICFFMFPNITLSPGLNDESMVGVDAHGFSVGGLKVFAKGTEFPARSFKHDLHIHIYIYIHMITYVWFNLQILMYPHVLFSSFFLSSSGLSMAIDSDMEHWCFSASNILNAYCTPEKGRCKKKTLLSRCGLPWGSSLV